MKFILIKFIILNCVILFFTISCKKNHTKSSQMTYDEQTFEARSRTERRRASTSSEGALKDEVNHEDAKETVVRHPRRRRLSVSKDQNTIEMNATLWKDIENAVTLTLPLLNAPLKNGGYKYSGSYTDSYNTVNKMTFERVKNIGYVCTFKVRPESKPSELDLKISIKNHNDEVVAQFDDLNYTDHVAEDQEPTESLDLVRRRSRGVRVEYDLHARSECRISCDGLKNDETQSDAD